MSTLQKVLQGQSILDDVLAGLSHQEIAIKYDMSVSAVQIAVNDIFVQSTERYADLRQRVSMLSVLRYESLLSKVMPYTEATIIEREDEDGEVTSVDIPPDPRYIKLAVDIIKSENDIFDRERQIAIKTDSSESPTGMDNIDETILAGDELYKAASLSMSNEGVVGAIYADMTAEDVLENSKLQNDRRAEQLEDRVEGTLPESAVFFPEEEEEDELLKLARERGLLDADGE